MATLISASTPTRARSALLSLSSSSSIPFHKTAGIGLPKWIPQLGLASLSHWSGLKRLGLSITPKGLKTTERRGRCKGKAVQASLFGVGAPEALVIGVVALLVFGPKGLAEVARNLGKTLRAFQPTIRELQEVSREFKNTLEREIGLDEISSQNQNTYNSNTASTTSSTSSASNEKSPPAADPNGSASPNKAYTSEEYLKISEEQLKASAAQHQDQTATPESTFEPQINPQATVEQAANAISPPQKPENKAQDTTGKSM